MLQAAGPMQLRAGQFSGCKAVIHAMGALFDLTEAEVVLQVVTVNAFKCLNQQVALRNISAICCLNSN